MAAPVVVPIHPQNAWKLGRFCVVCYPNGVPLGYTGKAATWALVIPSEPTVDYCDEHKPLVTKSGRIMTDAEVEALAEEAERGYDISQLRERPRTDA